MNGWNDTLLEHTHRPVSDRAGLIMTVLGLVGLFGIQAIQFAVEYRAYKTTIASYATLPAQTCNNVAMAAFRAANMENQTVMLRPRASSRLRNWHRAHCPQYP